MSERTGIEWTEATWNPWMGCTKVSPGCAHCYMFREQRQYGRDPETVVRSKTKFREPLKWRESRLVFTGSWSDWFHDGADAWRDEASPIRFSRSGPSGSQRTSPLIGVLAIRTSGSA